MTNTPEHIDAFEGQIENSLDHRIEELSRLDDKKSEALKALKASILKEIKGEEGETKYSEDLLISENELMSIFDEIKGGNHKILEENGIYGYWDFQEFLGIKGDGDEIITFTESLEDVTLFGEKIDLAIPIGANEKSVEKYKKILKKIEERADLEPLINRYTKIVAKGNSRLEFSVKKEGEEVKYSATQESVLRIDIEPDSMKIKEWTKVSLERKRLKRALSQELEKDKTLEEKQREIIEDAMFFDYSPGEGFVMSEKYLEIRDKMRTLRKRETELEKECRTRLLFDEETEQVVREESDPRYNNNGFAYNYYLKGQIIKIIMYDYIGKYAAKELFPNGRSKNSTRFFSSGMAKSYADYDDKGVLVKRTEYREDGTVVSIRTKKREDFYSKDGNIILYSVILGKEKSYRVMLGVDGEEVSTLEVMKESNPKISDSEYLDLLAKTLNTPEKLHIFFEQFMEYVHDDPEKAGADHYTPNIGGTDYWQLAEETIHRVKYGRMLGDCDDYAFLARNILRRQGKKAYVQGIPGHGICLWVEKNSNENWDAYSMGTFGFDKNGNRYGMGEDPEKEEGYDSLEDAVNSLMPKYDRGGLGLEKGSYKYRVKNGKMEILHIPEKGKTMHVKDVPIDLLPFPDLIDKYVTAFELAVNEKYFEAVLAYEELLNEDFSHKDLYHKKMGENLKNFSVFTSEEEGESKILGYVHKYPERPEYQVALGQLYGSNFDENKKEKEREHYLLAIEMGAKIETPYKMMASYYYSQKDFENRIGVLELAAQRCPDFDIYDHEELVYAYLDGGYKEKAIMKWEEVIRKYPEESDPKISLAKIYHEDDPEKAEALYEEYIKEDPNKEIYRSALSEFYNWQIRKEISDNPKKYDPLSKYTVDGKIDVSSALNEDLLKEHPALRGRYEKMVTQYREAYRINNKVAAIYLPLIRGYGHIGDYKRMTETALEVIRLHPDDQHVRGDVLRVFKDLGRLEDLYIIFEKQIADDPENPDSYIKFADLCKLIDREKAHENYMKAIEKGSQRELPYREASRYFLNKKQYSKQAEVLESAIKKIPGHIPQEMYTSLGYAYEANGEQEKAIDCYESIIDRSDNVIMPLAYLYFTYEHNSEKAIRIYFSKESKEVRDNKNGYEYQIKLSRMYDSFLRKAIYDDPSQFEEKYRSRGSVMISPEFLKAYPKIAEMMNRKTKALEKACQQPEAGSFDYERLMGVYINQREIDKAIKTIQILTNRFQRNSYNLSRETSILAGLYVAKGDVKMAIQIYLENSYSVNVAGIKVHAVDLGASKASMQEFFKGALEGIRDYDKREFIYNEYLRYLSGQGLKKKFQTVYKEAIKEYPESEQKFDRYLRK